MKKAVRYTIFLLIVFQFNSILTAQEPGIEKPVSFVALASQNDFYQYHFHSDRNFTNGFQVQTSFPVYEKVFTKRSLIGRFADGSSNFIIALGQEMYTPADIETTEVDSSDRPYAGTLFLRMNRTISNKESRFIIQSNVYIGVIGPASGAEQSQNFIHRVINNDEAQGWDNQISNGLVLDYNVNIRKGIKDLPAYIDLSGSADIHVGTIYNYATLGGRLRFGLFNDPYINLGIYKPSGSEKGVVSRRFQIYLNAEANGGYLFYDGTLSGSILPFSSSTYIIEPADVHQWMYTLSYGITFSWKTLQVNFLNLFTNPLYSQEKNAGWGQLDLIFSF